MRNIFNFKKSIAFLLLLCTLLGTIACTPLDLHDGSTENTNEAIDENKAAVLYREDFESYEQNNTSNSVLEALGWTAGNDITTALSFSQAEDNTMLFVDNSAEGKEVFIDILPGVIFAENHAKTYSYQYDNLFLTVPLFRVKLYQD